MPAECTGPAASRGRPCGSRPGNRSHSEPCQDAVRPSEKHQRPTRVTRNCKERAMRLLKEPLLHFVVLGGLMFAAYSALGTARQESRAAARHPHDRRRCRMAEGDVDAPVAPPADRRGTHGSRRGSSQGRGARPRGAGAGTRRRRHRRPPPAGAEDGLPPRRHDPHRRATRSRAARPLRDASGSRPHASAGVLHAGLLPPRGGGRPRPGQPRGLVRCRCGSW